MYPTATTKILPLCPLKFIIAYNCHYSDYWKSGAFIYRYCLQLSYKHLSAILTLYIKVGTTIGCFIQSICCRTPVFSRMISFSYKAPRITLSHSLPIFNPCYSWRWVASGSTVESHFLIFHN